jgi:hypothetical protein
MPGAVIVQLAPSNINRRISRFARKPSLPVDNFDFFREIIAEGLSGLGCDN